MPRPPFFLLQQTLGSLPAVRSVFGVLSRHISEGQVNKVREALPRSLRQSWLDAEKRGQTESQNLKEPAGAA